MKNESKKLKKSFSILRFAIFLLLVVYTVFLLTQLVWALMSSLKSDFVFESTENGMFTLPKFNEKTFDNYVNAFSNIFFPISGTSRRAYLLELLLNSVIYTIGCAFLNTFVPFLMAYLTARFKYKFSKVVYITVLVVMMIPIVGNLPGQIQMAVDLGIFNTLFGVYAMQCHFLGMYFLVFHAAFSDMPNDYVEAAQIDGASNTRIMFTIMMPMAKNVFLAVFLLRFIFYWNDYSIPLVFLKSRPTLALGMLRFSSNPSGQGNAMGGIPSQMAGAMIFCIPVFILFMIFRNKLMGNISMGGIKG